MYYRRALKLQAFLDMANESGVVAKMKHDLSNRILSSKNRIVWGPAVISAIDEETEFNALVEEGAALLESPMGER
ncbi:hypothetical protein K2173_000901 [Erythroxylum novogranatense]|uniref:Uncharacterized protein n=1 Tax=Erythroxylum novogranatense TaxID=1862640 RepID=A0AAV8TRP0_9ROSI|nr:hypothetical protein K2173_000901 [Erythroxylum novogranatense]